MDFAAAYDRYAALVLGRCRRLLMDARDAEETAQEAWLAAWQAWERAPVDERDMAKWLTVIATHKCRDRWRRDIRRPHVIGEPDARKAGTCDVEGAVLLDAELRQVLDALDAMPHTGGVMLLMMGVGYRPCEMARAGSTLGTVKGAMHRARAELRKRVA